VNGPLVEVDGLTGVAMSEVVELGRERLSGEVVAIRDGVVTAQVYEYTGGLTPGEAVSATGSPLSARLGPHLLGRVFDGLLRPLGDAPLWLAPGRSLDGSGETTWAFAPAVAAGAAAGPGTAVGTVEKAGGVAHRVLVPPGAAGTVESVAPAGEYSGSEPVAVVGGAPVTLVQSWPVRRSRPVRRRLRAAAPLVTGQRVIDLLFPLARGTAAGVPGGFGTGKTVLLQQIAKWCDADVIVYVGCGERGNEMADVLTELAKLEDPRGGRLADRTVVIANTSNMPMMAREASIYSGVTVAEYFRDMGHDAVVIADSTSRWAEALREFSSRVGALPTEEGYPADLATALGAFYERAGRMALIGGGEGSVTIIGAVSPPGGDMAEPVTANTQRFVRALWTLDRELAYARHYPAVGWQGSFARDLAAIAADHAERGDPDWAGRRTRVAALLAEADRVAALAELVGAGALPAGERVTLLAGRLLREGLLQQSAISPNDAFCAPGKQAALAEAVLAVVDACREAVDGGVPASAVEEFDFTPLLRAAQETGPDAAEGVRARRDAVLDRLRALR
jgi:V/A-type H+-transporting ATPase subunit A